jgi:DNA-binding transcriptional ArsR family regulator
VFSGLGHSRTAARVLGVLLIEEDADASDLAGYLGVAKSSMSVALRRLEESGLVTRFRHPGQRRDRYRADPEAFRRGARAQITVFGGLAETAERGLSVVGEDPVLRQRLEYMRDLYLTLAGELSRLLDPTREAPGDGRDSTTPRNTVDVRTGGESVLRHSAQRTQSSSGEPQGGPRYRPQGDRAGGQAHGGGHQPGVDQGSGHGS